MKLINEFNYDDVTFFSNLAAKEGIEDIKGFVEGLNFDNHTLQVKYYKDEKGCLYVHYYFDGQKVNRSDLNGYYKGRIGEFETKTNVLFQ